MFYTSFNNCYQDASHVEVSRLPLEEPNDMSNERQMKDTADTKEILNCLD